VTTNRKLYILSKITLIATKMLNSQAKKDPEKRPPEPDKAEKPKLVVHVSLPKNQDSETRESDNRRIDPATGRPEYLSLLSDRYTAEEVSRLSDEELDQLMSQQDEYIVVRSVSNKVRNSALYEAASEKIPPSLKSRFKAFAYALTSLFEYKRFDMFATVAIETTSICNRACGYCPNSNKDLKSQRPQRDMDQKTFNKIVDQLKEINYQGVVSLQHYGEPLLDRNLDKRIRQLKDNLPDASIRFFSNGDKLTPERLEALVEAGVDNIGVTNHNESGFYSRALAELEGHLAENPEMERYVTIRHGLESYSNRGGDVNVPEEKLRKMDCCIPESYCLNIDVEGNVILCADDYVGKHRFGNIRESNILQIWDQPEYKTLREELRSGTFRYDTCKKCAGQE
jgi:radical SAM protein with 4Fe4S-binding SPASM domain